MAVLLAARLLRRRSERLFLLDRLPFSRSGAAACTCVCRWHVQSPAYHVWTPLALDPGEAGYGGRGGGQCYMAPCQTEG